MTYKADCQTWASEQHVEIAQGERVVIVGASGTGKLPVPGDRRLVALGFGPRRTTVDGWYDVCTATALRTVGNIACSLGVFLARDRFQRRRTRSYAPESGPGSSFFVTQPNRPLG